MGKNIITYPNGMKGLSQIGKQLAIKRSRIVAGAKAKLFALEQVIAPYIKQKNILVYCGATRIMRDDADVSETDISDERQIIEVTRILGDKLKMDVCRFTSEEPIDKRGQIKTDFANGILQALIAIKCLDEGVNIPSIRTAFILASTTNPKEYIQRRGRVLRLFNPDPIKRPELKKEFAEIYDFITLPMRLDRVWMQTEEEVRRDSQLVKNELGRLKEFARLSMNPITSNTIIREIEEAYRIDTDNK
jgi:superfamily II DNA or RNA helicase